MVANFFSRGLSTNDHRHVVDDGFHAESHGTLALKSRQNHGKFALLKS